MPVCFFNSDYDAKNGCEYEIKDGMMKIIVNMSTPPLMMGQQNHQN